MLTARAVTLHATELTQPFTITVERLKPTGLAWLWEKITDS
jgi:hypothetical protein